MAGRTPEADPEFERAWARAVEPSRGAAAGVALVVFLLLVSNGRPIPSGDTRVNDHVAASLATERDFDLDEYPEIEPPWVKPAADGRHVSIYPALSPLLAAPLFAAARLVAPLDETGAAYAGKAAASLFSALAAGVLFVAVARRRGESDGVFTAAVFALGTSVWSTSQALWQHPAAVLGISVALLFLARAEDDAAWAGRAGLPLGLAFAARHADIALVAVLAVAAAARWPRKAPWLVLWSLPPLAFVGLYNLLTFGAPWRQGFGDATTRFDAPWGVGHLGLLVSPAKGLLVFTPVVIAGLVGIARAWRRDRFLPAVAAGAALAHWALMGRWGEWHGGESWGPRMMTDALPALLLFLPEGVDVVRIAGVLLAAVSIGVQALGAFSYDLRWERLVQRPAKSADVLWRLHDSPIPFHVRERVAIFAAPGLADGKVIVRRHPEVVGGPTGTRVRFGGGGPIVEGTPPTFGDAHLQYAAQVEGDAAVLRGHWSGVFLRVRPEMRLVPLVLTVEGRGHGTLYVGERSFWSASTRWATHKVAGPFQIRHRYFYPESGGGDIVVTVGRAPGEATVRAITLSSAAGGSLGARGGEGSPAGGPSPP